MSETETVESTDRTGVEVRENTARNRFEILVDGQVAGVATYQLLGGDYALMHTKIDDWYEGRGLGSTLIGSALRTVGESGGGVLPYCPFVLAYLQRHPEHVALVPQAQRAKFGLLES